MQLFTDFLIQILTLLHQVTGNLGLDIILFTIIIRVALLPLTLPSLKAGQKLKELQPEIKKLQQKHQGDKKAMQLAQVELYKKYNVNPLAGCLPQLLQIGILILLYQVMVKFLSNPEINGVAISPYFGWLNLSKPDSLYILPILAALSQLFMSLMIAPGAETRDIVPNKSKSKKIQKENKKEENVADMAQSMQQQMVFLMPIMTGIIALNFPSGLALYWIVTTLFSIVQQYYISGLGGIKTYALRLKNVVSQTK
jgi:YidC/Oxa1 family membrane protein insertase